MSTVLDFSYLDHGGIFWAPMSCHSTGPDALKQALRLLSAVSAQPPSLGASHQVASIVHHAGGLKYQLLYHRAAQRRIRPVQHLLAEFVNGALDRVVSYIKLRYVEVPRQLLPAARVVQYANGYNISFK